MLRLSSCRSEGGLVRHLWKKEADFQADVLCNPYEQDKSTLWFASFFYRIVVSSITTEDHAPPPSVRTLFPCDDSSGYFMLYKTLCIYSSLAQSSKGAMLVRFMKAELTKTPRGGLWKTPVAANDVQPNLILLETSD